VSGDTLKERKPHPAPLLHACALAGCQPADTMYVGDAERDIEAGRNAGMHTLVALFGYLMEHDRPEDWGADALIKQPSDILEHVTRYK
jgi:phosphoglycolate phosphatase